MQKKLVWTLAVIGILVVIGSADGCRLCGTNWCSCGGPPAIPAIIPRPWHMERPISPAPIELSLPIVEPQPSAHMCQYCGGYNRGYHGYAPRNENAHSRGGYYCRCSPRRHRYRYDDY